MHVNGLTIRTFANADSVARALARHIARSLQQMPHLVLGLPTGRTPIPLYAELVRLHDAGLASFAEATTFNLDEFLGIEGTNPCSYRAFMDRHLFAHVDIRSRRIHFLNGAADDPNAECRRYERQIARAGGIDLLLLGLGTNGHIGFNEPGVSLMSATHRTRLTTTTRRANASLFGGRAANVPREALSMGMGTILHARRIILLATGPAKAAAVRRLVRGPITPKVPASFLQVHRSVEVWVDRAAGAQLTEGEA
ncbi:MAG: glucosamine-6-phosphate deaminase [Vicinamibacterales bacterium]